jgi:hypothetical protein
MSLATHRGGIDFSCEPPHPSNSVARSSLSGGVAGIPTTLLLHAIERLTYQCSFASLLQGVTGRSPVRRAVGR